MIIIYSKLQCQNVWTDYAAYAMLVLAVSGSSHPPMVWRRESVLLGRLPERVGGLEL